MTIRITDLCSAGEECPAVDRTRDGWLDVTGYALDEHGRRLPGDPESIVQVPAALLGDTADLVLPSLAEFIAEHHRTDALRVQSLDFYGVGSDEDDYRRYQAGLPFQPSKTRAEWAASIRDAVLAGRHRRNLHIVREPLTDYLRYQFEWGYTFLADHGMELRVLPVEAGGPALELFHVGDFTVVEHVHVARSRYNTDGGFEGAVQVPVGGAHGYIALAELAWHYADPFDVWWDAHPQYHRSTAAA